MKIYCRGCGAVYPGENNQSCPGCYKKIEQELVECALCCKIVDRLFSDASIAYDDSGSWIYHCGRCYSSYPERRKEEMSYSREYQLAIEFPSPERLNQVSKLRKELGIEELKTCSGNCNRPLSVFNESGFCGICQV
jgi:hypothetical protein